MNRNIVAFLNSIFKVLGLITKESPLTPERRSKLKAAMQKRALNHHNCNFCNSSTYIVEGIFEVKEFHQGNFVPGATMLPFVVISCNNCGHIDMFSAVTLGFVDQETGKIKLYDHED